MPIETINFNGTDYPALQSKGFAAKFAFPFAQEICKGEGVDVGYSNPKWKLRGAKGIDLGKVCYDGKEEQFYEEINAVDFADRNLDYIFSSHCLEHLNDWVGVLDIWNGKLKPGGVLFLYLPNCDYQEYWQPANNRKHINHLTPDIMRAYFKNRLTYKNAFVSEGYDINGSFYAIAEKV